MDLLDESSDAFNTELEGIASSRSMCSLDWVVSESIINDGDLCNDIFIQVNGLMGTCEGCQITSYQLLLNGNGAIEGEGVMNLGNWVTNTGPGQVGRSWVGSTFFNPNLFFTSFSQQMSLINLGSGETIQFSYNVMDHDEYDERFTLFEENDSLGFERIHHNIIPADVQTSSQRIKISCDYFGTKCIMAKRGYYYQEKTGIELFLQDTVGSYILKDSLKSLLTSTLIDFIKVSDYGNNALVGYRVFADNSQDTMGYVDYYNLSDFNLDLQHRFIFSPDDLGYYGNQWALDMSSNGRYVSIYYDELQYIYDMNEYVSSIESVVSGSGLSLYPNPVESILHFADLTMINNNQYLISGIDGSIVMNGRLSTSMLDVTELSRGIYILKIKNGQDYFITKFIKR